MSDKSPEPMWERKPVQITGGGAYSVVALCNDGTLWEQEWTHTGREPATWRWVPLKPIPQT
jgi:hypothetical protein